MQANELIQPSTRQINPIHTGLFWIFSDRGGGGGGGGNGNGNKTYRIYIMSKNLFFFLYTSRAVMTSKQPPSWIRHLGFQNFFKTSEDHPNLLKNTQNL